MQKYVGEVFASLFGSQGEMVIVSGWNGHAAILTEASETDSDYQAKKTGCFFGVVDVCYS